MTDQQVNPLVQVVARDIEQYLAGKGVQGELLALLVEYLIGKLFGGFNFPPPPVAGGK